MKNDNALREKVITFLIAERNKRNPRHIKYVDRRLFANDNWRQIEEMIAFQEEM